MKTRITITIPPELLAAADRKAEELDRSRSWVLVEALRDYLDRAPSPARFVRDSSRAYVAGLGPSRQAQLEADLALDPEERVRLAEETTRLAELRGSAPVRDRVIVFDRHEDFFGWEKREALSP